ncbi:MAG: DUF4253 domain-containing protein [Pirellulaceae bacterium]|nr:DUF4253 domain-containing protein [Pirellulaceae bacterium]
MRFDGRFQSVATVLAVVLWGSVTGCDTAPDVDSSPTTPAASLDVDPFNVVATDGQYDPPPLLEAISEGDLDRLRDLLAAGEDVNQHDPVYGTPLVAALQTREDAIVAAVLEAGANRDGTSAYFLAAGELTQKAGDSAVRAVADKFAERNQLSLRVHDDLPALLLFDVADARGQSLVDQHRLEMIKQDWFLFRFAHDARRRQDVIGLLPTSEKYVVLAYLQTDGLNYNISTERIIDWLRQLETEQPFVVTEAGLDYVGGKFLQRVDDPRQLAERMFAFCPDIVDQGVGSVSNLEKELAKPSPQLYLWWD